MRNAARPGITIAVIPIPPGPFPGRGALLARATTVQIAASKPTDASVLMLP